LISFDFLWFHWVSLITNHFRKLKFY
jgi:hypothetical protein